MAFEEDRLSGHGVQTRIESGQGCRRAKHVVPVVHHAVRMAGGLRQEGCLGLVLVVRTLGRLTLHPQRGHRRRCKQQPRHEERAAQDKP